MIYYQLKYLTATTADVVVISITVVFVLNVSTTCIKHFQRNVHQTETIQQQKGPQLVSTDQHLHKHTEHAKTLTMNKPISRETCLPRPLQRTNLSPTQTLTLSYHLLKTGTVETCSYRCW